VSAADLQAHLASGTTTVCRCWAVTRRDGVVLGFTDHDRGLSFEGIGFRADTGLTARAVEQTTGLAVDNSEAVGALSGAAIREEDVRRGLFDGAELRAWLVNWADVEGRRLTFRGELGEIERSGKTFRVELRGLTERLNQPGGRVYQKPCGAVLGDAACGVDVSAPEYSAVAIVVAVAGASVTLSSLAAYADAWFERGRLRVEDGGAVGLIGLIRRDHEVAGQRQVELWEAPGAGLVPGDTVRLEAGCDKRVETCRVKFGNLLNFRGFPDIPGEDWLAAYPVAAGQNDGGSRRS